MAHSATCGLTHFVAEGRDEPMCGDLLADGSSWTTIEEDVTCPECQGHVLVQAIQGRLRGLRLEVQRSQHDEPVALA